MAFEGYEKKEQELTDYENILDDIQKKIQHIENKIKYLGDKTDILCNKVFQKEKLKITEEEIK